MKDERIKTIDMTRRIREKFARRLAGKTHAERKTFYRQRAMKMDKKIPTLLNDIKHEGGSYSNDYPVWSGNQDLETIANSIREKHSAYRKRK